MRAWARLRIVLGLCVLLAMFILLQPRPASAWTDELLELSKRSVLDASGRYRIVKAELQPIDPAEWTAEQHSAYLNASLWVIYAGLTLYTHEINTLPDDLSALAGTIYIPEWPANPYNAWQPVRVLTTTGEFSPGDVVWQVCPSNYYSGARRPRPKSCELSIYAPSLEFANPFFLRPLSSNRWARTPAGSAYILGQNYERTEVTRRKIAASRKQEERDKKPTTH